MIIPIDEFLPVSDLSPRCCLCKQVFPVDFEESRWQSGVLKPLSLTSKEVREQFAELGNLYFCGDCYLLYLKRTIELRGATR